MTMELTFEELQREIVHAITICPSPNYPNRDVIVSLLNRQGDSVTVRPPKAREVESALKSLVEKEVVYNQGYKGFRVIHDGLMRMLKNSITEIEKDTPGREAIVDCIVEAKALTRIMNPSLSETQRSKASLLEKAYDALKKESPNYGMIKHWLNQITQIFG